MGAVAGSIIPVVYPTSRSLVLPLCSSWHDRGRRLCRHPSLSEDSLQHQRDPDQPDAGLCGATLPRLDRAQPLARPEGLQLSADGAVQRRGHAADAVSRGGPRQSGLRLRPRRRGADLDPDEPHAQGLRGARAGLQPAGRALRRLRPRPHGVLRLHAVGRAGRACRHLRSIRRDRAIAAVHLARLRLHRHHRGLPRPAQPARHRRIGPGAGADLSRRRGGAERARHLRQGGAGVPGHAAVLRARCDTHAHPYRIRWSGSARRSWRPRPKLEEAH